MRTFHDYPHKRYGVGAMNPRGTKYDPTCCASAVYVDNWRSHQCTRPSGHGDRALFCKQHARKYPAAEKEIDEGAL